MSSTGRGTKRRKDDAYYTPRWTVRRLLEAIDLPDGKYLDPCAGDGAIPLAVGLDRGWTLCDIREETRVHMEQAQALCQSWHHKESSVHITDYLAHTPGEWGQFDVGVTNPPFSLAEQFLRHMLQECRRVVLLLRTGFLHSAGRNVLMRTHTPNAYLLPNRPSFTEDGRVDSTDYGWFEWYQDNSQRGVLHILHNTPKDERI